MIELVIISGRSGSGKSTALHILEDLGFYCIDNLPVDMLPILVTNMGEYKTIEQSQVAVSIDARNTQQALQRLPQVIQQLESGHYMPKIIYLDAQEATLVRRFSETRRRHPLSNRVRDLKESLAYERELLEPIIVLADLVIDTSDLTLHNLRDTIHKRIAQNNHSHLALQFISFAFKHGVPIDADLVFDARCLPNPYWKTSLRQKTGCDQEVIEFLQDQPLVKEMYDDIRRFLNNWLPRYKDNKRSYITIAIGCTGGQHRSVFLSEQLASDFAKQLPNVQVRHREIQ